MTVLIIYLDGLPRRTLWTTFAGATALLGAALWGLWVLRDDTSLRATYLSFTWALVAWGWQETAFYTGIITGPRRTACPSGCGGPAHFVHAVEAVLYHELAILATAIAIWLLTADGANPVGRWTFLLLWLMRKSAKLNFFLGVRNTCEEFLPAHLRYLTSFFRRRRMNLLMPVSVGVGAWYAAGWVQQALLPALPVADRAGCALLGALAAVATLEHLLLVAPLPATTLWSPGLRSHRERGPDDSDPEQVLTGPTPTASAT